MKTFVFGSFQLLPTERILLASGKPVRLGGRAMELLVALVERAGVVVDKRELTEIVWPKTIVEEATLRVHISVLRKVLGDGRAGVRYIENSSGRGYRFVAPVQTIEQDRVAPATQISVPDPHCRLPAPLVRMIGRGEIVSALMTDVPERRFVTLVGPGGIGKTTVALTVAHRLAAAFSDGTQFVDLTPLADPTLVASTLASALGLPVFVADPMPAILSSLRDKQMLIVLDNCEYVLHAIAQAAEKMLRGAPNLCIIATSREPLRAEGEWVRRLKPLEIPPPGPHQETAAAARSFAAVELFVDRAGACDDTFVMQDADVPVVAEICRRLDGIPLAIELAAARIELLGLRGLAAGLHDRLHVLTQGRRTAPPRHRTLRAAIDWSVQLLSPRQQIILRRLGVFHGAFEIEAVYAVMEDAEISRNDLFDALADFVAKSLMVANTTGETVTYQLLETVRAYVIEQLAASDEYRSIRHRHAEWCCAWADASGSYDMPSCDISSGSQLRAGCMKSIDELRSALEWSFSPQGDWKLGVKLTAVSAPVWFQHGLVEEYRVRAERALKFLDELPEYDPAIELQLRAALGDALLHTRGPVPEMAAAFNQALRLAEGLDSPVFRRRALWGLWLERVVLGDYVSALQMARRFQSASYGDSPLVSALNERIMAVALHFTGAQRSARDHAELSLTLSREEPIPTGIESAFQYCCVRAVLARALWIQGFPEQAMRMAHESVTHLRTGPAAMTLSYALACACAVFVWAGDTATAAHYAGMLIEHATRHSLVYWQHWGHCIETVLCVRRGEAARDLSYLQDDPQSGHRAEYLCTFLTEELSAEVIERAEGDQPHWCTAEVLRVKAEMLLRTKGSSALAAAEALFARSLDIARQQGACSWELRTAMSLARLRRAQGRTEEADCLLASVLNRFTEGFETSDLASARALLTR